MIYTTKTMTEIYFITGTDTDIGKTTATIELIKKYQSQNKSVLALKPVASGCVRNNNKLYNQDALILQKASNLNPKYELINPFRFEKPVSPHIVNSDNITALAVAQSCLKSINIYKPDICFIEGAGGWLCPLNNAENFADIVTSLQKIIAQNRSQTIVPNNLSCNLSVILVIGIKLGCLNHAMLTYNSIRHYKHNFNIKLNSWVANHLTPRNEVSTLNIDYLKNNILEPLAMEIDYQ